MTNPTSGISSNTLAVDATTTTSGDQTKDLGRDAFLQLLTTQLSHQDPMKPQADTEFIAQLAQFSGLEINRQQSEKIDTLLTMENANQALSLMGKNVEVRGAEAAGAGSVTAVSFVTGEPRLTVRTSSTTLVDVRLSNVQLVR